MDECTSHLPVYISEVLREALDHYVFVYLDDILIYGQSMDEHVVHVIMVLQLLPENHLDVKLDSLPCSVNYLPGVCGIQGHGLSPDQGSCGLATSDISLPTATLSGLC